MGVRKYVSLRYVESRPCLLYVLVTDRLRDARAFQRYTFSYLRAYAPYRGTFRMFQFYYVQEDLVGAFLNHVPRVSKVSDFRGVVVKALKMVEGFPISVPWRVKNPDTYTRAMFKRFRSEALSLVDWVEGCEVVRKVREVKPREVKPEVWTFEASYAWRKRLRRSIRGHINWVDDDFAYAEFSRSRWYCTVDWDGNLYCVRVGSGDVSVEFLKAVQKGLINDKILDDVCDTYREVREVYSDEVPEGLETVCMLRKFIS